MPSLAFLIGAWLVGGVVLWLPSLSLRLLPVGDLGRLAVGVKTVAMPAIALAASWLAARIAPSRMAATLAPFAILLGMWSTAPILSLGSVLGNHDAGGWIGVSAIFLWLPMITVSMAAYDGSLGGLLIATVLLLASDLFLPGWRLTRGSSGRSAPAS